MKGFVKLSCMINCIVVESNYWELTICLTCGVLYKDEKNRKKLLTKGEESGRIVKLSQRTADIHSKRVEKFFKEISKNLLTSQKDCDIITKLPRKTVTGIAT